MFSFLADMASSALPLLKAAAPVLLTGLVVKHTGKIPGLGSITKRVSNDLIPVMGLVVSGLTGGGIEGAAVGVFAHRLVKSGVRGILGQVSGSFADTLNAKVGPGNRISI